MRESQLEPLPCKGTYFQLMRYDKLSTASEQEFAEWLTREVGVAAIPVSAFYADKGEHQVVRFCFAKEDQTLSDAAKRLVKLG